MLSGSTKVDAITGDWLSEYNIGTRALQKASSGAASYEPGFLHSLRLGLSEYKSYPKQLKCVVNAGGGNPKELALRVQQLLSENDIQRTIAHVSGDDILERLESVNIQPLTSVGESFASFREDKGKILSANAYIGATGIQLALEHGADIVIAGRCTDASPVVGLCAWWHGWKSDDHDQLAGSLLAGHLIECGCYVCGGSFAGFQAMGPKHFDLSFPIAEISSDGSAIIQKQPGQNGMVTVDTVRTQFVYELQGTTYLNPDVVGDFTNVRFAQCGNDRVQVSGAKGLPAQATLKLALTAEAGYQAEFYIFVSGLQAKEKVESFKRMSLKMVDASVLKKLEFQVCGAEVYDPNSLNASMTTLRVFAQADDAKSLTRGRFLGPLLSNQLQGFPALTPILDYRTADPKPFVKLFTGLVPATSIVETCHMLAESSKGHEQVFSASKTSKVDRTNAARKIVRASPTSLAVEAYQPIADFGPTKRTAVGDLLYGRSGDKGANVNVGLFFPLAQETEEKWQWLRSWLSTTRLIELMGDDYHPALRIERCEFPLIRAVHFVVYDFLGSGVSSTSSVDALGKGFVEFIRAREVDVPAAFVPSKSML